MFKRIKNRKGFTLIELAIVLVVLGVVAAISFPKIVATVDRIRFATVTRDLQHLASATEIFWQEREYGEWPADDAVPADIGASVEAKFGAYTWTTAAGAGDEPGKPRWTYTAAGAPAGIPDGAKLWFVADDSTGPLIWDYYGSSDVPGPEFPASMLPEN